MAWGVCLSYGAAINYLVDILKQIRKINAGEMAAATAESVKVTDSSNNFIVPEDGAVNYTAERTDGAVGEEKADGAVNGETGSDDSDK